MQHRPAEQSAGLSFCKYSGKEKAAVADSESNGTMDILDDV